MTKTIISRFNSVLSLAVILSTVVLVAWLNWADTRSMVQIKTLDKRQPDSSQFLTTYEISGPFSDSDNRETVNLELSCCNQTNEFFEQSLVIKKGSTLVTEEGQSVSFSGVCLTNETRLALLVYNWDGSPTIGGVKRAHIFNPDSNEFDSLDLESYIDVGFEEGVPLGGNDLIQCDPGEQLISNNDEPFKPCYCNLEPLNQANELAIEVDSFLGSDENLIISDFENSFFMGSPHTVDFKLVGAEPVDRLLNIIDEADSLPFSIKKLENDQREVLSIIYTRPVYDSFSALLTRNKGAPEWQLIYRASPSSKGFHPQFLDKLHDDSKITVALCTEDCSWWGRRFSNVDIVIRDDQVNMFYRSDIEE